MQWGQGVSGHRTGIPICSPSVRKTCTGRRRQDVCLESFLDRAVRDSVTSQRPQAKRPMVRLSNLLPSRLGVFRCVGYKHVANYNTEDIDGQCQLRRKGVMAAGPGQLFCTRFLSYARPGCHVLGLDGHIQAAAGGGGLIGLAAGCVHAAGARRMGSATYALGLDGHIQVPPGGQRWPVTGLLSLKPIVS